MKAYVYKTSEMASQGQVMESKDLETLCGVLLEFQDFNGWKGEIIISKPDIEHPLDEREKQCDWVIEIYDDYRE